LNLGFADIERDHSGIDVWSVLVCTVTGSFFVRRTKGNQLLQANWCPCNRCCWKHGGIHLSKMSGASLLFGLLSDGNINHVSNSV